jgi:Tfp pilus assembly protein PilF
VSAILAPGEALTLQLSGPDAVAVVNMRVAVRLDIIVPRNHALIRHRAERYNPDTIFDVGRSIVRRDGDEREIARLRQALKYNRFDAVSAAKLGEMLLQRAEYAEARYWLLQAQENAQRLPDGGARVAQNLRQLERQAERLKVEQELAAELRLVTPRTSDAEVETLAGLDI